MIESAAFIIYFTCFLNFYTQEYLFPEEHTFTLAKISNDNAIKACVEKKSNSESSVLITHNNEIFEYKALEGHVIQNIIFNNNSSYLIVKFLANPFVIIDLKNNKFVKCDNNVLVIESYKDDFIVVAKDDYNDVKYKINYLAINSQGLLIKKEIAEFFADSFLRSIFSKEDEKIDFIIQHENKILKLEYLIKDSLIHKTELFKFSDIIYNIYILENSIYFTIILDDILYINIYKNKVGFSEDIKNYNLIENIYFIDENIVVLKEKQAEIYSLKDDEIIKSKTKFEENKILKQSSLSADEKFLALLFDDNSYKIFDINNEKFLPVFQTNEEIKKVYFDDYKNKLIVMFDKKMIIYNCMSANSNLIGEKRKFESEPEENSKKSKLE